MSTTRIDSRDRAFERLYRRHARDVYRFVLAVVRNPHEAEDVTQTAFLNAYRAYKRGDRPERPQSWLIAIAHNAIRSRHRWTIRRPREVAFDEALLNLAVAPAERTEVAEVLHALAELPVNQREALAMRELEGRTYDEIAATLGVTVPAVESLIARARRTLRAQRATLRGLTAVQLPRSLRRWLEHGDASGTGLAAKAAIVVAAATVVAGGAGVDSKVADAGHRADRSAPTRLEPHRRVAAATAVASATVAVTHARPAAPPISIPAAPARPAERHAAPLRRVERPVRSPVVASPQAVEAPSATAPAVREATPPPAAAAAGPNAPAVSAIVAAAVAQLPTVMPVPDLPAAPTVTVPAVTVPAVPVPGATLTVTVPQVPSPGGIK
jgi:RNA polymerase sigma-70 factor, ECF subfamily